MEYALLALIALGAYDWIYHHTPWLDDADRTLDGIYQKANRDWRR